MISPPEKVLAADSGKVEVRVSSEARVSVIVAIWDSLGLISRCHSSLWGFVHICVKYHVDVIIGY